MDGPASTDTPGPKPAPSPARAPHVATSSNLPKYPVADESPYARPPPRQSPTDFPRPRAVDAANCSCPSVRSRQSDESAANTKHRIPFPRSTATGQCDRDTCHDSLQPSCTTAETFHTTRQIAL